MTTLAAIARASNALLAQSLEYDRLDLPELAAKDAAARKALHELAVTLRTLAQDD